MRYVRLEGESMSQYSRSTKPPVQVGIIGAGFTHQVAHLTNYVGVDKWESVALG